MSDGALATSTLLKTRPQPLLLKKGQQKSLLGRGKLVKNTGGKPIRLFFGKGTKVLILLLMMVVMPLCLF